MSSISETSAIWLQPDHMGSRKTVFIWWVGAFCKHMVARSCSLRYIRLHSRGSYSLDMHADAETQSYWLLQPLLLLKSALAHMTCGIQAI
jgi:hypothetical protein